MADEAAAKGAREWREFWASRGMRELRVVLSQAWGPLSGIPPGEDDCHAFRVASLLASRAPADALAEELGRIRRDELRIEPDPDEDARAAERIVAWFHATTAART